MHGTKGENCMYFHDWLKNNHDKLKRLGRWSAAGVLRVEDSVNEQEILEASNTKDQHEQRKA